MHKKNRRYTWEERIVIQNQLLKGMTYGNIGAILDRTRESIKNEVLKNGGYGAYSAEGSQTRFDAALISRANKLQKKFTAEEEEFIHTRRSQGIPLIAIAAETGISLHSLKKFRDKFGDQKPKDQPEMGLLSRIVALEEQMTLVFDLLKEKG